MRFLESVKEHAAEIGAGVVMAVAVIPASLPIPASFSLDLSGMVDFAETIFNALSPIVVIVGGIVLGLGLVGLILSLVMKAVRGGGKG